MSLETRVIKQPKPVNPADPNLFRFCPSCGEEALEPNTHVMDIPTIGDTTQIAVHGWECTACGKFWTATHLGIAWVDLTQCPLVTEMRRG